MDPNDATIYPINTRINKTNSVIQYDSTNQMYYVDADYNRPVSKLRLSNLDISNIPPQKLKIKYVEYNSNKVDFPSFTNVGSIDHVSVSSYQGIVVIAKVNNPGFYRIYWFCNYNSYSTTFYFPTEFAGNIKMKKFSSLSAGNTTITLLNENSEPVLNLNDFENTDTGKPVTDLYYNYFDLIDFNPY